MGTIDLNGHFRSKHHHEMPISKTGRKTIHFKVQHGKIRIHHKQFDIHSGAWTENPQQRPAYYDLEAGDEKTITLDIRHKHQRLDKVFFVNRNFWEKAKVTYREE